MSQTYRVVDYYSMRKLEGGCVRCGPAGASRKPLGRYGCTGTRGGHIGQSAPVRSASGNKRVRSRSTDQALNSQYDDGTHDQRQDQQEVIKKTYSHASQALLLPGSQIREIYTHKIITVDRSGYTIE